MIMNGLDILEYSGEGYSSVVNNAYSQHLKNQ